MPNQLYKFVLVSCISLSLGYQVPPSIFKQPSNTQFEITNKTILLECEAIGVPAPQYRWTKNGNNFDREPYENRIFQRKRSGTLLFIKPQEVDMGEYQCFAENRYGVATSNSVHLRNATKSTDDQNKHIFPSFTVKPKSINATKASTVDFECVANGVPTPEITWIHNGRLMEESWQNLRRQIKTNRITIENVTKNDTGNYGCFASNPVGRVYHDFYINVLTSPEIIEAPSTTQTYENYKFELVCKVVGSPQPIITWTLNNTIDKQFQTQTSGSLLLNNAQLTDSGNYKCTATNQYGTTSKNITLIVKKTPFFMKTTPKKVEAVAGSSPTFSCIANANDSEIIWLMNDVQIDFENETRFVRSSKYSLTIIETVAADIANYTCSILLGDDQVSPYVTQLIVTNVPNPPKILEFECFAASRAKIKWNSMGDNRAPITEYRIEESITQEIWTYVSNVSANVFEYDLNKMPIPWANYTFRIIAVNKIGKSLPSKASNICESVPDVPYKNPGNVTSKNDDPNHLVITWTPMSRIDHNAPNLYYRVAWKAYNEQSWQISNVTNNRLVVRNQPCFQAYNITVRAINEKGEANIAPKEEIGYSGEGKPIEAPRDFLMFMEKNTSKLLFKWKAVNESNIKGRFLGYKIRTWSDISPIRNEYTVFGNVTMFDGMISCDPSTYNYAQVFAFNSKYGGPASVSLRFWAPETRKRSEHQPAKPLFTWDIDKDRAVRIQLQKKENSPRFIYFVKFKKQGDVNYFERKFEKNSDFIIVDNLPDEAYYNFFVTIADGGFRTNSNIQMVYNGPNINKTNVGILLGFSCILFMLVIGSIFKRNKGGNYYPHESEETNPNYDFPEEEDDEFKN